MGSSPVAPTSKSSEYQGNRTGDTPCCEPAAGGDSGSEWPQNREWSQNRGSRTQSGNQMSGSHTVSDPRYGALGLREAAQPHAGQVADQRVWTAHPTAPAAWPSVRPMQGSQPYPPPDWTRPLSDPRSARMEVQPLPAPPAHPPTPPPAFAGGQGTLGVPSRPPAWPPPSDPGPQGRGPGSTDRQGFQVQDRAAVRHVPQQPPPAYPPERPPTVQPNPIAPRTQPPTQSSYAGIGHGQGAAGWSANSGAGVAGSGSAGSTVGHRSSAVQVIESAPESERQGGSANSLPDVVYNGFIGLITAGILATVLILLLT